MRLFPAKPVTMDEQIRTRIKRMKGGGIKKIWGENEGKLNAIGDKKRLSALTSTFYPVSFLLWRRGV